MRVSSQSLFYFCHIEPDGTDFPGFHPFQHGLRIEETASGRVNQNDTVFHGGNRVPVYHVMVGLVIGGVINDDVTFFVQLRKRDVLCVFSYPVVRIRVIGIDLFRVKTAEALHRRISDPSGAYDADFHVAQFSAERSVFPVIAVFDVQDLLAQMAQKRKNHHDRIFRYGIRGVCRDVGTSEAIAPHGIRVEVIVPGTAGAQIFHAAFGNLSEKGIGNSFPIPRCIFCLLFSISARDVSEKKQFPHPCVNFCALCTWHRRG